MENLGKIIDAVLNECWGGQKTKTVLQVNHEKKKKISQADISFFVFSFKNCPSFSIDGTGADIEPYLPTLMETMLSALNNSENLKIKELSVSAIGAIGKNSRRKQKFYRFNYPNSNNCIFVGNYDTEKLD